MQGIKFAIRAELLNFAKFIKANLVNHQCFPCQILNVLICLSISLLKFYAMQCIHAGVP